MSDGRWLSREDVARHLGIKLCTVAAKVRAGLLPAPSYHLGQQLPRWDMEAIDKLMAGADPHSVDDAIAEIIHAENENRQAQAR